MASSKLDFPVPFSPTKKVTFEEKQSSFSLDKYFMECNQYETAVGNISGDTDYDGKVTLADTFAIYKAVTEEKVCYNGDVNGDLALDAKDVLLTINHRIVEHLIGK